MDSLAKVDEIRDLLRTIPIVPSIEEAIQREALVETVHYTTRIEGNPLDIRAVERLGTRRLSRLSIDRPDEQEVVNLYKVMEFIRDIGEKTDVAIDEEVIKQIHAYVVRDIPEQGPPGVYKMKPNEIIDEATRERIYLPPSPWDTPGLMSEFNAWLSRRTLVFHPIITAGVAHLELVAIHPFQDGNGRTARALADLILYRYGYSLRYLFSWVGQVGIDMGTYHQSLRRVLGERYGANVDPTIWLEYFIDSVVKSLIKRQPELLRLRDTFVEFYNLGAKRGLLKDQVEAFVFAVFYDEVSTGEYMRATGLSRSTAVKRLNELVKAGDLERIGRGRNVRYIPGKSLRELPSTKQKAAEDVQLGLKIE